MCCVSEVIEVEVSEEKSPSTDWTDAEAGKRPKKSSLAGRILRSIAVTPVDVECQDESLLTTSDFRNSSTSRHTSPERHIKDSLCQRLLSPEQVRYRHSLLLRVIHMDVCAFALFVSTFLGIRSEEVQKCANDGHAFGFLGRCVCRNQCGTVAMWTTSNSPPLSMGIQDAAKSSMR